MRDDILWDTVAHIWWAGSELTRIRDDMEQSEKFRILDASRTRLAVAIKLFESEAPLSARCESPGWQAYGRAYTGISTAKTPCDAGLSLILAAGDLAEEWGVLRPAFPSETVYDGDQDKYAAKENPEC